MIPRFHACYDAVEDRYFTRVQWMWKRRVYWWDVQVFLGWFIQLFLFFAMPITFGLVMRWLIIRFL